MLLLNKEEPMASQRKRRTRAEISRILQLYRDAELSQREFARRHRISVATVSN
jgi:DNA-binding transcriptional regulator YiaG